MIFKNKIKEIEKGCGKDVNPYKDIIIPCGDMAGGSIYYCSECESNLKLLRDLQKEIPKGRQSNIKRAYEQGKKDALKQVQEKIDNWLSNLEGHFAFTYLGETNERVIEFNPSVKVWEKEFKEKLKKSLEEME